MAVTLSANYSKKIGLPNYSSHSFMASVEVELSDLSQLESECQRLYQMLQQSVDREIQTVGYLPDNKHNGNHSTQARHTASNGQHRNNANGHYHSNSNGSSERWQCTDGQRGYILRIISDNQLNKQDVDALAQQLFNSGVKQLNKMQASQLIDELLEQAGKPRQQRWRQQEAQAA